jgi:acyl-CoA dehydrogenase
VQRSDPRAIPAGGEANFDPHAEGVNLQAIKEPVAFGAWLRFANITVCEMPQVMKRDLPSSPSATRPGTYDMYPPMPLSDATIASSVEHCQFQTGVTTLEEPDMHFAYSSKVQELSQQLSTFLQHEVLPAEPIHREQQELGNTPWVHPPIVEELKSSARAQGLWNLFLPDSDRGAGLTNLEYAPLAELTGRSPRLAPEAVNCSAPDTGNMEILLNYATPAVQERFLAPLLAGEIRSCYSMTEPDVASSDANNISSSIAIDGDDIVIRGRKWWSSGAMSDRCKVAIVMGLSDPNGQRHRCHSMVAVPLDHPGVHIERSTKVFGYTDGAHGGHAVINFDNVRVPKEYLLGEIHGGFSIAQARLGPGRIHHCMRLIGMAERAFYLMCLRANRRYAFGKSLAEQGVIQDWIAEARLRIEQARLLVLKTAWLIDSVGAKDARTEISAIKAVVPSMSAWVIDRAIQTYGGAGVSDDTPLAGLYAEARYLRIADGPDEVHKMTVARRELRRIVSVEE